MIQPAKFKLSKSVKQLLLIISALLFIVPFSSVTALAANTTLVNHQAIISADTPPVVCEANGMPITDPSKCPIPPVQVPKCEVNGMQITDASKCPNAGITPCGDPNSDHYIRPSIDLGCRGVGNGILDLAFAIIRLLSFGVGVVVVGSIIVAGIQYTSSRGDPQAVANAIKRLQSTVIALLIYIFAFAILNFILPGAILK